MDKKDLLLVYSKYGDAKVGFLEYSFVITSNYCCGITLTLKKEIDEESSMTKFVYLDESEMAMIDDFCESVKKEPIDYEFVQDEVYNGFSFSLFQDGKMIKSVKDNDLLQRKFFLISDSIQTSHEDVDANSISEMYNNLCRKIYLKK